MNGYVAEINSVREERRLPVVLSQTFRAMIQSRMLVGMRTYKESYPHTDVLLFEPDRGDRLR